ncbi:MAG: hypothetical protein M3R17_03050 [Bacteroidota bacterium]|nr:hypothetical protein [Bacteroidota bacterium]
MKKHFLVILPVYFLLFSCNGNRDGEKQSNSLHKDDTAASSISKNASVDPHYFDYSKTVLTREFADTVFAKFSSATSDDRFTFFVPKGNINDTKSVLRITNERGDVIYENIFPTRDLVYGYGTSEVKTEKEMVEYILEDAGDILQAGILDPNDKREDSFLNQFTADNFDRKDVYDEVKNSRRMLFHYRLNNESNFVLGFSEKGKAVVTIFTCC